MHSERAMTMSEATANTANGKADDHFNEIAVSNVGVVFDAEYGLTIFALKSAKPWRIRPQIPVSVKSW